MVYRRLITFIEEKRDLISELWVKETRASKYMPTYNKLKDGELKKRSKKLIDHLILFLKEDVSKNKIGRYFAGVGRERYKEKFPLCEVQYAVYLLKTILWKTILEKNIFDSTVALQTAMELQTTFHSFFDKGIFFIIRGYMEKQYEELRDREGLSENKLIKYFFSGSFLNSDVEIEEIFEKERL